MVIVYDIETSTNGKINSSTNMMKLFGYIDTKNNKLKILRYTQKALIRKVLESSDDKIGYCNSMYDNKILRKAGYTINGRIIDLYHTAKAKKYEMGFVKGEGITLDNVASKLKLGLSKGKIDYAWLDDDKLIKEHKKEIYKYLDIDLILTLGVYNHFEKHVLAQAKIKEQLLQSIS